MGEDGGRGEEEWEGAHHEEIGWLSWGGTKWESKEIFILIEGDITGLGRNMLLVELPGIHNVGYR